MDFEHRLKQAIQRGRQASSEQDQARSERVLGVEELRRLHSESRLQLSEHIDTCLHQLSQQVRGFHLSQIVGEEGWGAEVQRDDLGPSGNVGGRTSYSRVFTRLQLVVRPFSTAQIVEITGKATIRNKEIFNRAQFQRLPDVDVSLLKQAIDQWVLEFAEKYMSS